MLSSTQYRDKIVYSIRETCLVTGLSQATIHKLCNEGHLTRCKVGKRTFIRVDELDCYLRSRPSAKWRSGKRA
jgi:excisionase family DNA binding protein